MRIDGEWALLDDDVMRPIVAGDIKAGNDAWVKVPFLVDTGADRTVFSAATLANVVATQIRLTREDAGKVVLRGQYVAVTELEALDISVLGRDITGLFAVIVDKPRNVVCLLGQRHRYTIEQD
jgi:hypothetical protein